MKMKRSHFILIGTLLGLALPWSAQAADEENRIAGRARQRAAIRIANRGLDGIARVVSCREGSGHRNYKPLFHLELEVKVSGADAFSAMRTAPGA